MKNKTALESILKFHDLCESHALCVGIFTAYMHIPTKGFISSILIAKINICMTFTLIIYIYRPTEFY